MDIRGKYVRLRAIEHPDLPLLQKWFNDPEIQECLGGWHFPTSFDQMTAWLSQIQHDELNQRFAVESPEGSLIGTANLVDINWKDRNAFHGMLLGSQESRGKGYAVDTVMAVMRYAFEELGLVRLDGSIIEYNTASLALYTKCGWNTDGTKTNAYWRKNQYWDKLMMGITREGYLAVTESTGYWE